MGESSYAVHGLVVRAPFRLNAIPTDLPDVDVTMCEGPVAEPACTVEPLLVLEHETTRVEAHRSDEGQVWITFRGLARFSIDGNQVTFEAVGDPAVTRILCEGWILAMVLFLADHAVLHASAVTTEHGTYAFAGNSGGGKSTLAGLLCREGARLVTDDVARVDVDDSAATLRRGSIALRLRPAAFTIADDVAGEKARTADDRLALAPAAATQDPLSLDAVLLPWPDRSSSDVEVTWLEPGRAAFELLRRPRLAHFVDEAARRRELSHAARIAAGCRVGFLRVPWGPPWPTDLSARIAEATLEGQPH